MQLYINGELKKIEGKTNLRELLAHFKINPHTVVVELNELVIHREKHAQTALHEGDKVEIVQFVGGGSEPEPDPTPPTKPVVPPKSSGKKKKSPSTGGPRHLVIVESPAKAKTINKYLGSDYLVEASMGHVRDLPKSKMGINMETGFAPEYIIMKKAFKTVKHLKKQAVGKTNIFLAPDPDREGEAISWHLAHILKGENGEVTIRRVVFNEITKDAVKAAFDHPRDIKMNLVNAQQARRILDRIVGYELSPLLWKKVGRGLSAGRVQSVALRLITDREREIKSFVPVEYWSILAKLSSEKPENAGKIFVAKLDKIGKEKAQLSNRDQTEKIRQELLTASFKVEKVEVRERARRPHAPFTTSKLQQEAYNRLGFPAAKTMRIAQRLYEGAEIGSEGSVGLITYMRTDSVNVSATAQQEAARYLTARFGASYLPKEPPVYRSKKGAQEAHEAIRPTSAYREPESIRSFLEPDEFKLYDLIWRKFLASQMLPALDEHMAVTIVAATKYFFKATGRRNIFPGFAAIMEDPAPSQAAKSKEEKTSEEAADDEDDPFGELPALTAEEILKLHELTGNQHFTKPPGRFNDASLVKTLEENGIGRPSTYAPTIYTLLTREYVMRKGGALMPTELGETVAELLVKHFPKILDVEFTARMEGELDRIEDGDMDWETVLKDFYGPFQIDVAAAKIEMKNIRREVVPTEFNCDICGKTLLIKWGRFGKFLACSGFPECKYTRSMPTGFRCPNPGCGGDLVKRTSKNRRTFYGCSNYPKCNYIANKLPKQEETVSEDEKISERDGETLGP